MIKKINIINIHMKNNMQNKEIMDILPFSSLIKKDTKKNKVIAWENLLIFFLLIPNDKMIYYIYWLFPKCVNNSVPVFSLQKNELIELYNILELLKKYNNLNFSEKLTINQFFWKMKHFILLFTKSNDLRKYNLICFYYDLYNNKISYIFNTLNNFLYNIDWYSLIPLNEIKKLVSSNSYSFSKLLTNNDINQILIESSLKNFFNNFKINIVCIDEKMLWSLKLNKGVYNAFKKSFSPLKEYRIMKMNNPLPLLLSSAKNDNCGKLNLSQDESNIEVVEIMRDNNGSDFSKLIEDTQPINDDEYYKNKDNNSFYGDYFEFLKDNI